MNRAAIYHRPMSEYCHGLDEGHIVYRLRCAKGDLCLLYTSDAADD